MGVPPGDDVTHGDAGFRGEGQGGVEVSTVDKVWSVRDFKGLRISVRVVLRIEVGSVRDSPGCFAPPCRRSL